MAPISVHKRHFKAFLSHAHADGTVVDRLYTWLNDIAHIPIWYDRDNLAVGAEFATKLPEVIAQCQGMIIVLSKASVDSGWVKQEFNAAINHQSQYKDYMIWPIRIEDCEVPGFLQNYTRIEMLGGALSLNSAQELLSGLYSDAGLVEFIKKKDIYVSRTWHDAEAPLADYVCTLLDRFGLRLIGDAEDQARWDEQRCRAIISGCAGFAAILPHRTKDPTSTSPYILKEIAIAQSMDLACLVVAEPSVQLAENVARSVFCLTGVNAVDDSSALSSTIGQLVREEWTQTAQSSYCFLATNLDGQFEQRNRAVVRLIRVVTGMPCFMGREIAGGALQQTITELIRHAELVIADVSDNQLNTCIEAGIARGAGTALAIVSKETRPKRPFMLADYEFWGYKNDAELLAVVHRIVFPYRRRILNRELAK